MQFEMTAKKRNDQGTGASRRLRRAGRVPAIVYGGTEAAQAIDLDMNTVLLNLRKEAFHASVLTLDIEGKKEQVLLRDSQMHPYRAIVLTWISSASTPARSCTRRCRCTSSMPTSHRASSSPAASSRTQ